MFQKISTEEDVLKIKTGDWIVKYPLTGRKADEIDLSDERLFMLYEVCKIDVYSGAVHLQNLDMAPDENNTGNNHTPEKTDEFTLLEKHKTDLISDAVWWYRS